MIQPTRGTRGMAVAPHALAGQSALAVLREGGNALEAMIAAAATIAVVYPHMNSIGGDAFWVFHVPGEPPRAIAPSGPAAGRASIDWYRDQRLDSIPFRGGVAANTVAGTVSGWQLAYAFSRDKLGGPLPLTRLLADAITYARDGIAVTRSQTETTRQKLAGLAGQPGFDEAFLVNGAPPATATRFRHPRMAATLERLASAGLDDFYTGDLARSMVRDLQAVGSPLGLEDLAKHRAQLRSPLSMKHSRGTLYNMPAPTQGVISLLILGILDRLHVERVDASSADYVHLCVEATKQAFGVRDRYVTDPT